MFEVFLAAMWGSLQAEELGSGEAWSVTRAPQARMLTDGDYCNKQGHHARCPLLATLDLTYRSAYEFLCCVFPAEISLVTPEQS